MKKRNLIILCLLFGLSLSLLCGCGKSVKIESLFDGAEMYIVGRAVAEYNEKVPETPARIVLDQYRTNDERMDVGIPAMLSFKIEKPENDEFDLEVSLSEDENFSSPETVKIKNSDKADFYFLKTNTKYFYKAKATLKSGEKSPEITGFFTTADTPRVLSVDGISNVRDIGNKKTDDGKTVKQGLLYRGSELDGAVVKTYKLTENGLSQMLSLGIKTDIDLRSPDAVAAASSLTDNVFAHDFYDSPQYDDIFTDGGKAKIKKIFTVLADKNTYPAYIHCTHGMDRTGTNCFLLGALLGVSKEDLLNDYEMTAMVYTAALRENLNSMISTLENFGKSTLKENTEEYLLSCGITKEQISSIREIFLGE